MEPLPRVRAGFGAALGFAAGVVATIVSVAVGAAGRPELGLVILAVAVAGVSVVTTIVGAALTALQCWAFYASFLVGRAGQLVFDARTERAGALLLVVAVLASAVAAAGTAVWARRRVSATPSARGRAAGPSPVRS
ncbi:hypothetical protein F0L68_36965 [Solihabitans fulvus]|uniref:Uncharacterized protein n=1 Tax=Solihabitans fulvus TaxID=1892852 RepID=A0A5B2WJ37_9PSEU|nr:hypothetical protein [Solihabitans fulvus]KAA2252143.1 hypothetical protein F0L68_36965 [Solihabitans fulvus]